MATDEALAETEAHGAQFLAILVLSLLLWWITDEVMTQRPRDEALERYL